jgi:hypothetical protein
MKHRLLQARTECINTLLNTHLNTEQEIYDLFSPNFKIFKMLKSYKHVLDGKPHKRRTVSVYMERKRD